MYTFYRSWIIFIFCLPLSFAVPIYQKKSLIKKQKVQLKKEFKEGILLIAASLSAGYSIENALSAAIRELHLMFGLKSLAAKEFIYISQQLKMNRTIEELFQQFGARSNVEEIESFAKVLSISKRSGGELVSVINHTAGIIRDKLQVEEEIQVMTASKQMEQKIMNVFPFFLILYLDLTSPGFFDLMYHTVAGRMMMTLFLIIYGFACWISKKIMDIEV